MTRKATWIIPGILVTLLMALLWAMPAFAATAGTISFLDKKTGGSAITHVSLNGPAAAMFTGGAFTGGGIWVQISDADENAPTKYIDADPNGSNEPRLTFDQANALDLTNLADMNNDGMINGHDIKVYGAENAVDTVVEHTTYSLDLVNGSILGDGSGTDRFAFHLNEQTSIGAAKAGTGDTQESGTLDKVLVDSGAVGVAPISVKLVETAAASGVFGAFIAICDASDATNCAGAKANVGSAEAESLDARTVLIPVNARGDSISITYKDASPSGTRTASIPLDIAGPTFSNISPASGAAGREDEPTVSFQVLDAVSGITSSRDDQGSIYIVARLYSSAVTRADDQESVVFERGEMTVTPVTNGFTATVNIGEGDDSDDELNNDKFGDTYQIQWWAVARDISGNIAVSDRDPSTGSVCDSAVVNVLALNFPGDPTGETGEEKRAEDIIGVLVGATDPSSIASKCDPFIIRVDSEAPTFNGGAKTGVWYDGTNEQPMFKTGSTTEQASTSKGCFPHQRRRSLRQRSGLQYRRR